MEGRDQPEGSPTREGQCPDTAGVALLPNLERVKAAAKQAAQTRFTALLHHIDEDALLRAFRRQKRQASAGVDGVTVAKYGEELTDNTVTTAGRTIIQRSTASIAKCVGPGCAV
ncbi:hypothetical protein ABIB75_007846 [Bradyrhizobium sp. GM2.2]